MDRSGASSLFRRALLGGLLAAPVLRPLRARAQTWVPSRPIRMIVPYGPGGGTDITARLVAEPMGAFLGQPVVVENRPGAGASIGSGEVARAPADGLTLLLNASAHVVTPAVMPNLPFDYATAFTPVSGTSVLPQVLLVAPQLGIRNLTALVERVQKEPRRHAYGSPGAATASHLASAALMRRAGAEVEHVSYRGIGPALQDMLAGRLAFVFASVASGMAIAKDGSAPAVAVSSATRLAALPEVPTVAERGFPGFELNEWNGIFAPAGLPASTLERLNAAVLHALATPSVRERLEGLGALTAGGTPEAFAAYVARQRTEMAEVIRAEAITIE